MNDRSRAEGFTLLEVMISLTLVTLSFVVAGMGIHSSSLAARETESRLLVQTQAQNLIDLMLSQRFGHSTDDDPTMKQIEELFDNDADAGDITLHQLSRWPVHDDGWRFSWNDPDLPGEWRVAVHQDIDLNGIEGNSTLSPARRTEYLDWRMEDDAAVGALEKSGHLLRIDIYYENEPMLHTFRAREEES